MFYIFSPLMPNKVSPLSRDKHAQHWANSPPKARNLDNGMKLAR